MRSFYSAEFPVFSYSKLVASLQRGLTAPTTPAIVGFHGSEANWNGTETIHTVVGSIPTTSQI
jgi:hypothetical protein